jgi:hypothetical protein
LPHGDNQFFLRLTAIIDFFFASRQESIFLCLTARINFIPPDGDSRLTAISIFPSPHSDNRFFFASQQESISFRLTAIHASRRYQFFLRLTAIIDFSLPHGTNRFHPPDGDSRLTAMPIFSSPHGDNKFFFASRQESISFRLTAIHAPSRRYRFSLRLTAIIDFSLPHGKNRFHSA